MSKNFDDLLEKALVNAVEDRVKTLDAYEKMKPSLSVETSDDLQQAMLVGNVAVKLLEQLTRSNEQIVKLAQLKERSESKTNNTKAEPVKLSDLLDNYPSEEKAKKV